MKLKFPLWLFISLGFTAFLSACTHGAMDGSVSPPPTATATPSPASSTSPPSLTITPSPPAVIPAPTARPGLPLDALSPDATHVELLAHLGGQIHAAVAREPFLYVAAGVSVMVFDISDPDRPVMVGQGEPLPDLIDDMALDGNYLYVVDGLAMHVLDVRRPTRPLHTITYDDPSMGNFWGVTAGDGYTYVAAAKGLFIFENMRSGRLRRISHTSGGSGQDVTVKDGYAYVAKYSGGVTIVDVHNPAAARIVGRHPVYAWDIVVADGYAFVANNADYSQEYPAGLAILDVRDPTDPQIVVTKGRAEPAPGTALNRWHEPWRARRLHLQDDYLYVGGEEALFVLDVRRPTDPQFLAYTSPPCSSGVAAAARRLYCSDVDELHVIDIADAANARQIATRRFPIFAYNVHVDGARVYLGTIAGHLFTLEKRNDYLLQIRHIDQLPGSVSDLWSQNGVLYVSFRQRPNMEGTTGVAAFDISGSAPAPLGQTEVYMDSLAGRGSYLYGLGAEGLHTMDVSDPTAMRLVHTNGDPDGWRRRLVLAGSYAYVIYAQAGLVVYDLADPAQPQRVTAVTPFPHNPIAITIQGDVAYLLLQDHDGGGVQTIDISTPTAPQPLTFIPLPFYPDPYPYASGSLGVAGAQLLVSNTLFFALDIQKPRAPQRLTPVWFIPSGQWDNRREVDGINFGRPVAYDMQVVGDEIYLATGDGLYVGRVLPTVRR